MSTAAEIKAAIDQLSPQERCELEAMLRPWPDDEWDCQMREDAKPGGKLHRLRQQAEAEAKAGKLRVFPGEGEE